MIQPLWIHVRLFIHSFIDYLRFNFLRVPLAPRLSPRACNASFPMRLFSSSNLIRERFNSKALNISLIYDRNKYHMRIYPNKVLVSHIQWRRNDITGCWNGKGRYPSTSLYRYLYLYLYIYININYLVPSLPRSFSLKSKYWTKVFLDSDWANAFAPFFPIPWPRSLMFLRWASCPDS